MQRAIVTKKQSSIAFFKLSFNGQLANFFFCEVYIKILSVTGVVGVKARIDLTNNKLENKLKSVVIMQSIVKGCIVQLCTQDKN